MYKANITLLYLMCAVEGITHSNLNKAPLLNLLHISYICIFLLERYIEHYITHEHDSRST